MRSVVGLAYDPVEVIALATMNPSLCVAVVAQAIMQQFRAPYLCRRPPPCLIVQHFSNSLIQSRNMSRAMSRAM